MSRGIKISIFYGPLEWFHSKLPKKKNRSFLELVIERDQSPQHHLHHYPGHPEPEVPDDGERIDRVVVESNDFASLTESAITNFAGLIRSINPEHLYVQNPPAAVYEQLKRAFNLSDDATTRYKYPTVSRGTLLGIEERFGVRVIGQEHVETRLLAALYPLTTAGRTKPAVLMLYGPSGVGKTETARFINELLGGELMRKQFSMFQNERFASYLFGGRHNETSFAHDLLNRDSGVILIDEFDKANGIFHSAFYQLFDEGVFVDRNYHVELGPALIICTSNYESEDHIRRALGDALFSRFDALIRYEALTPEEIRTIIDKLVDARLDKLSDAELAVLDRDTLREDLHPLSNQTGNVRRLGKFVDEVISLHLVRSALDQERKDGARAPS